MNENVLESYPIILTAKEISAILKVSKPTVYDLMNRSDFPLIKIGRSKRVLRNDFFEWLELERDTWSKKSHILKDVIQ